MTTIPYALDYDGVAHIIPNPSLNTNLHEAACGLPVPSGELNSGHIDDIPVACSSGCEAAKQRSMN